MTDESVPSYVWSSELDDPSRLADAQLREGLYPLLVAHVRRVAEERDQLAQKLVQVGMISLTTTAFICSRRGSSSGFLKDKLFFYAYQTCNLWCGEKSHVEKGSSQE